MRRVVQLSVDGHFIKMWESIICAERELHISNVHKCCNYITKTAGGYVWRYADSYKTNDEGEDYFS